MPRLWRAGCSGAHDNNLLTLKGLFVSLRTVRLCDRLRASFGRQQPHGCPVWPASRQLKKEALLSKSFKLWRNDNNNLSALQALGETASG